MFREEDLYVFDFVTSTIKKMTEEVDGKLLEMDGGTSTFIDNKIINIGEYGTYIFYPDELRCELLNQDLK